jgi:hypothetical protein
MSTACIHQVYCYPIIVLFSCYANYQNSRNLLRFQSIHIYHLRLSDISQLSLPSLLPVSSNSYCQYINRAHARRQSEEVKRSSLYIDIILALKRYEGARRVSIKYALDALSTRRLSPARPRSKDERIRTLLRIARSLGHTCEYNK